MERRSSQREISYFRNRIIVFRLENAFDLAVEQPGNFEGQRQFVKYTLHIISRISLEPIFAHFLSLLVRWIHVIFMAILLGGAALLWSWRFRPNVIGQALPASAFLSVAERYEGLAWLGIGLLVLTGIGNLAAFREGLPGWNTPWGNKLIAKLLSYLFFMIFSLFRSMVVVRLGMDSGEAESSPNWRLLRFFYAGTALFAILILFLAVWLAHG